MRVTRQTIQEVFNRYVSDNTCNNIRVVLKGSDVDRTFVKTPYMCNIPFDMEIEYTKITCFYMLIDNSPCLVVEARVV